MVAASTQQQQKQCLLLQHILAVSNDTLVPPAGTPPSEAISAPPLTAANNALLQWMQANGAQVSKRVCARFGSRPFNFAGALTLVLGRVDGGSQVKPPLCG